MAAVDRQVLELARGGSRHPGDADGEDFRPAAVGLLELKLADRRRDVREGDVTAVRAEEAGVGRSVRTRQRDRDALRVKVHDGVGRNDQVAGGETERTAGDGAEFALIGLIGGIGTDVVEGDRVGGEIDRRDVAHLAAGLVAEREVTEGLLKAVEGAVDGGAHADRARARVEDEVVRAADVAVEEDVASVRGQRAGDARGADRRVDVDVAGIVGRPEDAAEIQSEVIAAGSDVAAQLDDRGEQREDRIAGARVVEGDLQVDLVGRLEGDVAAVERRGQGADADHRSAGGGQADDGTDPAGGDDLDEERVEEPGAGGALRGRGGHGEVIAERDARGGGLDEAAVAGHGGAGVEAAVGDERTVLEIAEEDDAALLAGREGAGFDHAVVVDRGGSEFVRGARGQQDPAAVGADGAAVVDHGLEGAAFDREADEAAQVQGDAVAGADEHLAAVGGEHAFVDDLRGEQGDDAAAAVADRGEAAVVRDDARAGSIEDVITREEIVVADRERGGDEAADVDLRAGGEEDAVGIDQEDVAVGGERAADDGSFGARHAVEHDGGGVGLLEMHRVAGTDGEALPVDDRLGGGLVDGHRRPLGRDRRRARGHAGSGR